MTLKNSSLMSSKNILSVSILIALIPNINQRKMCKEKDTFKNINRILLELLHVSLEILFLLNQNSQLILENI